MIVDHHHKPNKPMPAGGRVVQVFLEVDMRMQLKGLSRVAERAGCPFTELAEGEYVVFFNTARTIVAFGCAHSVVARRWSAKGRFDDISCLTGVVAAFNNRGTIDFDISMAERLKEVLERAPSLLDTVITEHERKKKKDEPSDAAKAPKKYYYDGQTKKIIERRP